MTRLRSMIRMRPAVLLAVLGLMPLAPGAVLAQKPNHTAMVGRRVVQRTNGFNLHVENRIIDRKRVIHFYRVELTNGPWLWVRAEGNGFSGWALADHVVPVDEGIEFFTKQIQED